MLRLEMRNGWASLGVILFMTPKLTKVKPLPQFMWGHPVLPAPF